MPDRTFTVLTDLADVVTFKLDPVQQIASFWAIIYCSSLKYDVTYDGVPVVADGPPAPITFTGVTRTFSLQTSDLNDVGVHEVRLKAYLTDYPDGISASFSFKINLLSPCTQPEIV